jgi:hypothetical protein
MRINLRSQYRPSFIAFMFVLLIFTAPPSSADAPRDAGQPAAGSIHGKAFLVERSTFEEGVLTLRQGKDYFADIEIILFLSPRQKHEIPSGKTITITRESSQNEDVPAVLIKWKEGQEKMPKPGEWFRRDYIMTLEFGEEKAKRLPGKINIILPDSYHSHVVGSFSAEIKGFKFTDGKPDLTTDSFMTLEYVAKDYLEKNLLGQPVKVLTHSGGRFTRRGPSGNTPFGFADIVYQIGNDLPKTIRLQFVKDTETWRVYHTLKTNQLSEAHPFEIPGAQHEVSNQFEYQTAKALEKEIQATFPDRGVYDVDYIVGYNPVIKMGECSVHYTLGEKREKFNKRYLMRLSNKGWEVDRELGENQDFNYKTGKIDSR